MQQLVDEDLWVIGMIVFQVLGSTCCWVGCSFTQKHKTEMFYVSPLCHPSRACSSDYFWTIALSCQVPKRKRCPSKKRSQLGDDVASRLKNQDLYKALHTLGLPESPQARWCSLQTVYRHSWAVESTQIGFESGLFGFFALILFHFSF